MRATKAQFDELIRSAAFIELKAILLLRLGTVRDMLEEVVPGGGVLEQAKVDLVNKGRAEELRYATGLADEIVNNWEEYTKEEAANG